MSNPIDAVGDVLSGVANAVGGVLGITDPYKAQKKALKQAEEEQKKMAEEEAERRRKTQRAALQPSASLFDLLGGSSGV